MKSLLAGSAVCAALAMFAGNADAHRAHVHKTHKAHKTTTTSSNPPLRGPDPNGSRINSGPTGNDPIYDSCEHPWRHLDVGCPLGR